MFINQILLTRHSSFLPETTGPRIWVTSRSKQQAWRVNDRNEWGKAVTESHLRWLKIKGHQRMLSVFLYHQVLLYSFKTGPCIQLKVWLLFRLVGQQSTCIYLPLSPNSRGTAISNHAWLLISVLEILTEVLVLTYQVFSPTELSPYP